MVEHLLMVQLVTGSIIPGDPFTDSAISCSIQCSMTGMTKSMVYAILHIKKLLLLTERTAHVVVAV